MALGSLGPLATARVRAIVNIVEARNLIVPRLWVSRLNRVQAQDDEILAKLTADVIAADIITDDAEARVHGSEQIKFTSGSVPNFKHGRMFSQANLRLISRIEDNTASLAEKSIFDNYINSVRQRLLQGITDAQEAVICQMLEDSGNYDRLGVKFAGLTWGMPAALKVTPATYWSDAANATPIADILAVVQAEINRTGRRFNRITLSTYLFNLMIATTEFQNRVKFGLAAAQAAQFSFNYLSQDQKVTLVGQMLNMTVELYDAQTKLESATGAKTNVRFSAQNKAILTVAENDNNNSVWDFAIGEIVEKQVARLANVPGYTDLGGGDFGPVSYTTIANPQLNPPGLIMFAVDRGFPRKHDEDANAVITGAAS